MDNNAESMNLLRNKPFIVTTVCRNDILMEMEDMDFPESLTEKLRDFADNLSEETMEEIAESMSKYYVGLGHYWTDLREILVENYLPEELGKQRGELHESL